MNYTTNYNLPQWEEADRVTRGDVNNAMAVIDAAIANAGNCRIVWGSYTGVAVGRFSRKPISRLRWRMFSRLILVMLGI